MLIVIMLRAVIVSVVAPPYLQKKVRVEKFSIVKHASLLFKGLLKQQKSFIKFMTGF
jgi:hypothetical protein